MKHLLLSHTILDHPNIMPTLKKHLTHEDHVLVILYSFFEMWMPSIEAYDAYYAKGGKYDLKIHAQLSKYGASYEYLNFFHDDPKTRLEKLSKATVLFFPGGAPDEMLERLKVHELIDPIKSFQGLTIGSSAGAMIHAKRTHIYKDHEYPKFSFFDGLGWIDGFDFSVHYRRRIQQKKAIKKMFRTYPQEIYVIPDDGALFVEDGKVTCLGSAKKMYTKKGIVKR